MACLVCSLVMIGIALMNFPALHLPISLQVINSQILELWSKMVKEPLKDYVLDLSQGFGDLLSSIGSLQEIQKRQVTCFSQPLELLQRHGKTADVGGDKDACGNFNPPGGPWLYKELSGTKKPTSNAKKSLGGFERHYNSCTQTVLDIFLRNFPDSSPLNQSYLEKHQPFIFNPETRSLISYNDPTSFRAKAKFVLRHGLSGVEVFNATGDTDDNILLRSVRKVLA
ncbi:hypothetical protein PPACK8108_LOCUS15185 [Phakopsora pachyrhizi]|uniref:Uncharacterized protein n=1 Tax=Phakopsora pachyrhizi TaxID=170000 RepID=A0AAV0BB51_PHAPC|nr:hypothetical protein PPACK8108_LOCUS15185 [Phakopsora pachyrhizi]